MSERNLADIFQDIEYQAKQGRYASEKGQDPEKYYKEIELLVNEAADLRNKMLKPRRLQVDFLSD